MHIELTFTGCFNRFELTYSASMPLRCRMHTAYGDEVFFLDPSENAVFSSFTEGFADGAAARGADGLDVEAVGGGDFGFALLGARFLTAPQLSDRYASVGSGRLKITVNLAWGGGISGLEADGAPDGVGNLLNRHDTGRLVQQSYYGTNEPPYTPGEFMGKVWRYNPVQGGDKGGKHSALVDYKISDREIYVKCRPRDWGHVGLYTDCYFENTYAIDGDMLTVSNRVRDFSGYDNPVTAQEMPAFYTISYLDKIWFYNGSAPWTGAPLTCLPSLGFWAYERDGDVFFLPGNTECWAAWTDGDGWGVGLFTPGAERLTSGRFSYNGSKDPDDGATNYVSPLRALRLSSEPIEYTYYVTAGKLGDIRSRFEKFKEQ